MGERLFPETEEEKEERLTVKYGVCNECFTVRSATGACDCDL